MIPSRPPDGADGELLDHGEHQAERVGDAVVRHELGQVGDPVEQVGQVLAVGEDGAGVR